MTNRSVYINKLTWMPGSDSMSSYVQHVSPAPAAYLSGLLDFDINADSYLDLNGDLNAALDWLLMHFSKLDTAEVEEIIVATSTLKMTGEEASRLWDVLVSPAQFPVLKNATWLTGKGCNVLTHAAGQAFNRIRHGAGAVLIICLEMHELGVSRLSDYAFFSDAAALLLLSHRVGKYEILKSDALVSYAPQKFAFTCSFPPGDYPLGAEMYTLHTFPFISSRKYQSAPDGLYFALDSRVKAHYYSLDPFIDLCAESSLGNTNKVIHVESPPFHVDELQLRQHL